MFVNKLFISHVRISQSVKCFNVKSSTYYFHMKTKILADFQICISVPLMEDFIFCAVITALFQTLFGFVSRTGVITQ